MIMDDPDIEKRWQHAVDTGSLSLDEVRQLREYEAVQLDAIAVDEFTQEELLRRGEVREGSVVDI